MVNGLAGKEDKKKNSLPLGLMSLEVAEHVEDTKGFKLIPESFTGPDVREIYRTVGDVDVNLWKPNERSYVADKIKAYKNPIHVDFTSDKTIHENLEFYCKNGFNLVMGTTGGKRQKLEERVKKSDIVALLAPNMCEQIVALQASFVDYLVKKYQGLLSGFELDIVESHQKGKQGTSGTAKAMVGYYNQLGIDFKENQITPIREIPDQLKMDVPKEHLKGHGWHTYTLTAPNKKAFTQAMLAIGSTENYMSDFFQFAFKGSERKEFEKDGFLISRTYSNNKTTWIDFGFNESELKLMIGHYVNGRKPYALGTLDGIRFTHDKVKAGEKGKAYSMIDVIKKS